jgi:hypothetical protein
VKSIFCERGDWPACRDGIRKCRLTSARGVDHIIEVGGMGTLPQSYQAIGFGGKVALTGFPAPSTGAADPLPLMPKSASLQAVGVGRKRMFEEMNAAIEVNEINPSSTGCSLRSGRRSVPPSRVAAVRRQNRDQTSVIDLRPDHVQDNHPIRLIVFPSLIHGVSGTRLMMAISSAPIAVPSLAALTYGLATAS